MSGGCATSQIFTDEARNVLRCLVREIARRKSWRVARRAVFMAGIVYDTTAVFFNAVSDCGEQVVVMLTLGDSRSRIVTFACTHVLVDCGSCVYDEISDRGEQSVVMFDVDRGERLIAYRNARMYALPVDCWVVRAWLSLG